MSAKVKSLQALSCKALDVGSMHEHPPTNDQIPCQANAVYSLFQMEVFNIFRSSLRTHRTTAESFYCA
eukprot:3824061-Amphidinium_carterae.1